jgi:hypothetical protein
MYPNTRFIFGPHFSVFPNDAAKRITGNRAISKYQSIYIQPSEWAKFHWVNQGLDIPIRALPFGVNNDLFKPSLEKQKEQVLVYYKDRSVKELEYLQNFLESKSINYTIFSYSHKYKESDFIDFLKTTKYAIVLGRHESQGFALEEMMSCNIPLFVWDVTSMDQEIGCPDSYQNKVATCIPYWSHNCGIAFTDATQLPVKFDEFIQKLDSFSPREFIVETLGFDAVSKRWHETILTTLLWK